MGKIAVIDYDAGNTLSVIKALEYLGNEVLLTNKKEDLYSCSKIVLPGVGAYYDCMQKLKSYELIDTIKEITSSGRDFLGICLGMQLLFDSSEETIGSKGMDVVPGLGILKGKIKHFKLKEEDMKIPHMGWNSLDIKPAGSKIFNGLGDEPFVYFVHSYYLEAHDRSIVASTTTYGIEFDSAVACGNIYGCQFHPEKSGDTGLKILNNFCTM